jgi:hypothetical protein
MVGDNIVATTNEPELDMVGIPFFGIELEDQGYAMPEWWKSAKARFGQGIPRVGRVQMAGDLLDSILRRE